MMGQAIRCFFAVYFKNRKKKQQIYLKVGFFSFENWNLENRLFSSSSSYILWRINLGLNERSYYISKSSKMLTRSQARKQNENNFNLPKSRQTTSLYLNCKKSEWVTPSQSTTYCFNPHQQNGISEHGIYVYSPQKIESTTQLWSDPINGTQQMFGQIIVEKDGNETLFTFKPRQGFQDKKIWYVVDPYDPPNKTEEKWLPLTQKHYNVQLGSLRGEIVHKQRSRYNKTQKQSNESVQRNNSEIEKPICRICFDEQENERNPFITPCKCKGSIGKVHNDCLNQWLRQYSKQEIGTNASAFYLLKYKCQICQDKLPIITQYLEKQPIFLQYFIQGTSPMKVNFVIHPEENVPVLIGSNENCDIRLNFEGISDIHSQIILKDNIFMIRDRNSKFGTLIQVKKPFTFRKNQTIRLNFQNMCYQLRLEEEQQ